ncbi:MAG: MBOAT family O-acyltransferase [Ferruginibacter sp.]
MPFTSLNFLFFFLLFAPIFLSAPVKYRLYVLLAGNYFFYICAKPVFAVFLVVITLCTFYFARLIAKTISDRGKKTALYTGITIILLPLIFFKYAGELNNFLLAFLHAKNISWPFPEMKLLLPVGISFYSFMAIGYIIDVYNEEIDAENDFLVIASFLSFFPLLLSGPIERAKNMLPQFKKPQSPGYDMIAGGMKFILWGCFMKLVIADRIGIYVDTVYQGTAYHNGNTLLLTSFLYPFQVYADLGGYSLIAIGTASVLGFRVMQNFNRPFLAVSMADLWRRWHISLITWLTDYVYTPLTFALRKYKLRGILLALMITFLLSGLWHGAKITFMAWGLMQGLYLCFEALTNKQRTQFEKRFRLEKRWWYLLLRILTVFVLFMASQIVGRADNLKESLVIFRKIFTERGPLFIGDGPSLLIYIFFGLLVLLFKDFTEEFMPEKLKLFNNKRKFVRIMVYSTLVILILLAGVFDGGQFIYFKF